MARPATPQDITDMLDRLERMPRLGRPLREDPSLRERLRDTAERLIDKSAPRSDIESHLRWRLRELM